MIGFVADTSAPVAILNAEPDAQRFERAFSDADVILISAATVFEAHCAVMRSRAPFGSRRLEGLIDALSMELIPFDHEQTQIAGDAYSRFGRGSGHHAKLNMGDCFAYALARSRDLPLLFKGDDFTHTDIRPAIRIG